MNITGDTTNKLKRAPGGPGISAIAEANIAAMAAKGFNDYVVVEGGNQGSNEFPYQAFLVDPYDSIAELKQSQVAAGGQYVAEFGEEDAEYLLRQRAQVENADFDRWVLQKYDLSNPGDRMVAQRVIPELFDRQKETLAYQTELQNRYAKLRIDGPKSDDDLKFEWLIESGRLQLPEGPLWDPQAWMSNQMRKYQNGGVAIATDDARSIANRKRYMAGLFSPLTPINENQTGWQTNYNNPSDIRGYGFAPRFAAQLFGGSQRTGHTYSRYGSNPVINPALTWQTATAPGYRFGYGVQNRNAAIPGGPPGIYAVDAPAIPYRKSVPAVRDPKTGKVTTPYIPSQPFVAAQRGPVGYMADYLGGDGFGRPNRPY